MTLTREKFNERIYREKTQPLDKTEIFRVESILKFIGNKKRVLDIGCCNGIIGELIVKNGNEVYGVDISDSVLKVAESKGIKTYKVDIESEKLPFPADHFDVVVAGEVIEHVFDTDSFLKKIKDVLKDGGDLIITTPNLATLGRRILLLLGKNPHMEVSIDGDAAGHIRYFIKETLVNLLKKHGFKIDKLTSDVVNFNNSGKLYSVRLARIFPTLGRTLIVRAKNIKGGLR